MATHSPLLKRKQLVSVLLVVASSVAIPVISGKFFSSQVGTIIVAFAVLITFLIFIKPIWGVGFLIGLEQLAGYVVYFGLEKFYPKYVVIGLILFSLLIRRSRLPRQTSLNKLAISRLDLVIYIWLLGILISWSVNGATSFYVYQIIKNISSIIIFLVICTVLENVKDIQLSINFLIFWGVVQTLVGGYLVYTGDVFSYRRLTYLAQNPNTIAFQLSISILLIIYFLSKMRSYLLFVFLSITACLALFSLYLTGSRSSLLSLIVMIIWYVLRTTHQRYLWRIGVFVFIVALFSNFLLLPFAEKNFPRISDRFDISGESFESSSQLHEVVNRVAIAGFSSNPLFGIGPGNALGYTQVMDTVFNIGKPIVIHNLYLSTLLELGIFGCGVLLALVTSLFQTLIKLVQKFKKYSQTSQLRIAYMLESIFIGYFLIFAMFHSATLDRSIFIFLAFFQVLTRISDSEGSESAHPLCDPQAASG